MTRTFLLALALAPAALGAQTFDEHFAKGRQFMDSSKFDDAVKSFEKAIKLNDKHSDAHLWLARALGSVAQNANVLRQPFLGKRAKSEFDKAAELDPNSVGAHEGLMQFYLRAPGVIGGSVAKAKEEAAIIGKINPYRGHFAAANIAGNQKDTPGIEKAWRDAATQFPDSLGGAVNYANFLMNNGRGEEAFAPLEKYLAKYPDNISAQFWIARAAAASGKQLDRGEQILRQLLAIPADKTPRIANEQLHFRLGDIQLKRGDKAKAKSEYEAALKINPRFEAAKKALEAVK
jgi:tetratricopeptide (TPR) repeat protein